MLDQVLDGRTVALDESIAFVEKKGPCVEFARLVFRARLRGACGWREEGVEVAVLAPVTRVRAKIDLQRLTSADRSAMGRWRGKKSACYMVNPPQLARGVGESQIPQDDKDP